VACLTAGHNQAKGRASVADSSAAAQVQGNGDQTSPASSLICSFSLSTFYRTAKLDAPCATTHVRTKCWLAVSQRGTSSRPNQNIEQLSQRSGQFARNEHLPVRIRRGTGNCPNSHDQPKSGLNRFDYLLFISRFTNSCR